VSKLLERFAACLLLAVGASGMVGCNRNPSPPEPVAEARSPPPSKAPEALAPAVPAASVGAGAQPKARMNIPATAGPKTDVSISESISKERE
jgi:hypothetical protein